ncbi:MAG: hypothetical protein AAF078_12740 [Planctomycetota bacterium]
MRYKTLFRLGVKLIGIWLIAEALTLTGWMIAQWTLNVLSDAQYGIGITNMIGQLGRGVLQAALGVYLLLGCEWVVNLVIPSNRPYCPNCGYDLTGRKDVRHCPECGVGLPAEL